LKEQFLISKSLETTSEVTDDQEEINNFFQQNKLVEPRWQFLQFCPQIWPILRHSRQISHSSRKLNSWLSNSLLTSTMTLLNVAKRFRID